MQLTKCPEDSGWSDPRTSTAPDDGKRWWSYCYNRGIEYGPQQPGWLSALEGPAGTVVMFDGGEPDHGVELTDQDSLDQPLAGMNDYARQAYARHNHGLNILWGDGHAKWRGAETIKHSELTVAAD